jgi:hypothetical protein
MSLAYFVNTGCESSRLSKLSASEVKKIRQWYDMGRRGKEWAHRIEPPITPSHFNKIGRRQGWQGLKENE